MTANPWEDFARRGRELYEQQAEVARTWLDGQSKLASTLGGDAGPGGRPWCRCCGNGRAVALVADTWAARWGHAVRRRRAGTGRGRHARPFLDPVSLALVGGSQVGEAIRKLTEGPRLADRCDRAADGQGHGAVAGGAECGARSRGRGRRGMGRRQPTLRASTRAASRPVRRRPAAEALKLWLEVANQTLLETHRSERFLAAQSQLLRHGMDFLLAEREMVETLVEPAGIPTRTEIDEVHRSLHELKRRVRILEGAAATPAAPPARPVKRPAARKRASGGQA